MLPIGLTDFIDETVSNAIRQNFDEDPLICGDLSLLHSFMSSVVRRDGNVIHIRGEARCSCNS